MNARNKQQLAFFWGLCLLWVGGAPLSAQSQSNDIPAAEYYSNTWNNDHIRISRMLSIDSLCIALIDSLSPQFCMPVRRVKVISSYGKRGSRNHTGIDLKQTAKDTIFAVFDGRVRLAKSYSGYGKTVVMRHHNGLETVYAHLSQIWVSPETMLRAGTPLGLAGRSGRATTEHLHFECRFRYEPFNPVKIIDFEEECLREADVHIYCGKVQLAHPLAEIEQVVEPLPINEEDPDGWGQNIAEKQTVKHHKIKRGDTLYSLAKRYGTSVDQLKQWNAINDPSTLRVGQRIQVSQP